MSLLKIAASQLAEEASNAAVSRLIKYLENHLEVHLVRIPGIEAFRNSKESGSGIRYVFDGTTKAIRLNWKNDSQVGNLNDMISIDIWNGQDRNPSKNVRPHDGESMMHFLPHLAKVIDPTEHVSEAKKGEFTPEAALNDFVKRLRMGKTFTRGDFIQFYHNENVDIFDTIVNKFANQVTLTGKRMSAKRGTNWEEFKKAVLHAAQNTLMIDDGGDDEQYDIDDDEDRVSFSDSLDHLYQLTMGVAKGSFNALFVGGRGGTGKTQTVEKALKDSGHTFVRLAGSATAAALYPFLHKHADDIILFDDADGVLEDQDGRNLLKAATDTKKIRTLSWEKSGKLKSKKGFDLPPTFEFEGRIIVISNLPLNKLDPDGALRTRGMVIIIDPTNDEMMEHMKAILSKIQIAGKLTMKERQKVYNVVRDIGTTKEVNLRTLVRALNTAASGVANWEQLVRLYA